MSKKSKLEQLEQTHGKTETFKPTTIDQILGDTGRSKYGTMDVEEYKARLNGMQKVDLQAHATKVGLVPIDDRERMIKRLVHEFNLHVGSYRQPEVKRPAQNSPMSPQVAAILARAR